MCRCSGGVTDIKVGDEPTGLVPALLYSGASSTVSTLWPIEDRDGARFARAFVCAYVEARRESMGTNEQTCSGAERIDEETSGDSRGTGDLSSPTHWINLAKVFQTAVLELGPDLTEPMLSWAGFVLHGFWLNPS